MPSDPWPIECAWCAARNLINSGMLRDRLVILCGAPVRNAFGFKWRMPFQEFSGRFAFIPRPNGYSWNHPATIKRCREFMRRRVFPELADKAFRS